METQTNAPVVAKKVWNIVRLVLVMLRKGIAKSKMMLELHLLLKRGKLAGKAFAKNLMFPHHDSHLSFISPRDYEFSCSNSPAYPFVHAIKRKHRHFFNKSFKCDDVSTLNAVQKVLEIYLNNDKVEASPMVALPGFGKSPVVRQLRITDSPFPLKDEGDSQVDKAAEEFINKFYKDLNLQKTMAVLDSPYHKYLWDR